MKEISLHILDIAMNSVKAGATLLEIDLNKTADGWLTIVITDNGCGMDEETVHRLSDPFFTTRTTRKVGMGVPLYILAARQTGGDVTITSQLQKGTAVTATFHTEHIDCAPLGDIVSTLLTIIQGNPAIDLVFRHCVDGRQVELDTRQIKEVLTGVPIDSYEVLSWLREYLAEQYI